MKDILTKIKVNYCMIPNIYIKERAEEELLSMEPQFLNWEFIKQPITFTLNDVIISLR